MEKKCEKIIRIALIVLACVVAGFAIAAGIRCGKTEKHHLVILHLNDTHSHLEPISTGEYGGLGGLIERAAYIDSVRQAEGAENVLLLHAGDFVQGSSYFTEFKGASEVAALNGLKYDAITLGNHEFDNGLEAMGEMLSGVEAPVVVCNYDFSPFEAGKYIKPYVVVEKAGLKIGIIGTTCDLKSVVSPETYNRIPENDFVSTIQKWADELRPQCDLVIVLSHLGYEEHSPGELTDPMLIQATRNIDLVVGGHSHTFLDELPYYKNLDGKMIPVVQDGCWGVNVGKLDITVRK